MTHRPLMSPQQPSFQEAGYAVAGRQQVPPNLARGADHSMSIPPRLQVFVSAPAIGSDLGTRHDQSLQGGAQRSPRGVGHMSQADSSDFPSRQKLDRQQHQGLSFGSPTSLARFLSSQIALIDFHKAFQPIPPRTNHRPTQFVQPSPCRLVAAQSQLPLDGQRTGPILLVRDMPHGAKPQRQRKAAALKDGSDHHRDLSPALSTKPQPTAHPPRLGAPTSRAPETLRPSQLLQVLPTSLIGRKLLLKLHQRTRVRIHTRPHYPMTQVESTG